MRLELSNMPAEVAALETKRDALERRLMAIESGKAERARELQAAENKLATVEDGEDDAAYVGARRAVRALKKQDIADTEEIAAVGRELKDVKIAILTIEEQADVEDLERVEQTCISAAQALDGYENRLMARRLRRQALGLSVKSRLDAYPARIISRLAARHFGRFGLSAPFDKRMD